MRKKAKWGTPENHKQHLRFGKLVWDSNKQGTYIDKDKKNNGNKVS